jgi:hypothetical protein
MKGSAILDLMVRERILDNLCTYNHRLSGFNHKYLFPTLLEAEAGKSKINSDNTIVFH